MNPIIKPRAELLLRKVGNRCFLVEIAADCLNMTDVFSLNPTAAALWQRMSEGDYTAEELADWMAEQWPVGRDAAARDLQEQLRVWREYGLLQECESAERL